MVSIAMVTVAGAGCGALRPKLDVPPGHRVVLGEVSIAGFGEPRVALDVVREDGSFRRDILVDLSRTPFAITLPPGRYRITRLRLNEMGRNFPDEMLFYLQVSFDVGDAAAVYVGRLLIERVVFDRRLRVTVQDDYDRAVPEFRALYPELPSTIARALMQAT
jgi:hypothetical protein